MNKYEQSRETIKELMKDEKEKEKIDKFGTLLGYINDAEKEHTTEVEERAKLGSSYAKLVAQVGTKDNPNEEDVPASQKTIEECAKEWLAKNKK